MNFTIKFTNLLKNEIHKFFFLKKTQTKNRLYIEDDRGSGIILFWTIYSMNLQASSFLFPFEFGEKASITIKSQISNSPTKQYPLIIVQ